MPKGRGALPWVRQVPGGPSIRVTVRPRISTARENIIVIITIITIIIIVIIGRQWQTPLFGYRARRQAGRLVGFESHHDDHRKPGLQLRRQLRLHSTTKTRGMEPNQHLDNDPESCTQWKSFSATAKSGQRTRTPLGSTSGAPALAKSSRAHT